MKYFFYLSISLLIIFSACNDSVLVGSDLLGAEAADVEYVDNLSLSAKTVKGDSSVTFRKLEQDAYFTTSYMVGSIDDPDFGKAEAISYFSPNMIASFPNFATKTLDSVVMVLSLDSLAAYGDRTATHDLTLSILNDRMEDDTYYSNLKLEAATSPFYQTSRVINYEDSLDIHSYILDTVILSAPQLRFKLDNQFWKDLTSAPDSLTEERFLEMIPGFELKSSPSANSMLGINLAYQNSSWASDIVFYYNSSDTTKALYRLPLGEYRHSYFTNDYNGSRLSNDLNQPDADCLYLESQSGTDISVDLSAITSVGDMILNYGELEVTVKPFDEGLYPAIEAIGAWYRNDEDVLVKVDRTDEALNTLTESYPNGEQTWTYKLDLTTHLNALKKQDMPNTELFLFAVSKTERANRSLIYGSSHPEHPLKLNLILTKP